MEISLEGEVDKKISPAGFPYTVWTQQKWDIVYAQSICEGVVAEYYLNEESETSQSEMESEDEVLDDPLLKNHEKVTKEVYDMTVETTEAWAPPTNF